MEEQYLKRFQAAMLAEALAHYGASPEQARILNGFENFIYAFHQGEQERILRLAHSSRRSEALIQAEADWINFLAASGVSVAPVIPTEAGRLVEAVDDGQGEAFLATAFVKAPGQAPWEVNWPPDDAYLESYGELLGRLHALTKTYQPGSKRRMQWDDPVMMDALVTLPPEEALAAQKLQAELDYAAKLPKNKDSFGLIHYDAHESNLLMTPDGGLTLIDFDDCCYGYFIHDIAIVLCHATGSADDREGYARRFLPPFLTGYSRHNRLDPLWLDELSHFLKIREIDLFGVIHRDLDLETEDDPWVQRFMEQRKQRIEGEIPYLEFDFSEYARYL